MKKVLFVLAMVVVILAGCMIPNPVRQTALAATAELDTWAKANGGNNAILHELIRARQSDGTIVPNHYRANITVYGPLNSLGLTKYQCWNIFYDRDGSEIQRVLVSEEWRE